MFFLFVTSCSKEQTKESYLFESIDTDYSGLEFNNLITNSTELNILNFLYFYNGSGIAAGDFNNDGLTDLYFTANQQSDRLYLNQGDFRFSDITDESNIDNSNGWTTGVTTIDINNDGLLDIYISKIGNYKSIKGHNLLFINQGNNKHGIPQFVEESKKYGLDFRTFSTQAVFFDYDLDGDLDLYQLNHSAHPNRTYGRGSKRNEIDSISGDKLYKNEDGKFLDATLNSGIYQGNIGYGLGISVGDLNNDGYPDIYIGNDFFENDYFYINNQDGTFTDLIAADESVLGHTTHFSMGNSIEDLNNDGLNDIVSVDMLPEDLKTYKTSALEYNYQIYNNYLRNGYSPQFMQNTLHLNRGENTFTQSSYLSGLAFSEWSWSPLTADFDLDGFNDIYITNGILGATNDMDFINFVANDNIQTRIENGLSKDDLSFIQKLPEKKTANYFFKNEKGKTFKNMKGSWHDEQPSFSNGCIYADLDNDGDLDIVVNNVNEKAFLLKNNTKENDKTLNHITVKFNGSPSNTNGIGAKVTVYYDGKFQSKENFPVKGYLSTVEPQINFGLGTNAAIDSLKITWPDKKSEVLTSIKTNTIITLDYADATQKIPAVGIDKVDFLSNVDSPLTFVHKENTSLEFNRDPLIPYATTNEGPDISVADFNNDGKDDLFISGAKGQASQLFYQRESGTFKSVQDELFQEHALNEDTTHDVGDINNDGFIDLIIASGGNEFKTGNPIKPRIYYNRNGTLELDTIQFNGIYANASKIKLIDLNLDNHLDVILTSDTNPETFAKTPQQYVLINDGTGNFIDNTQDIAPQLQNLGNIKDFEFMDLNHDGNKDLVVVGHFMPITIFYYTEGKYQKQASNSLSKTNGWWNCVEIADFDKDGDMDIMAGNWGLNSRLKASVDKPITLYSRDFDNNGSLEPLITYFYKNTETTFASKEELSKQMPFINKNYLSYKEFSEATIEEVFGKQNLKQANKKFVYELASCYFERLADGSFKKHILPFYAQVSSVNDILVKDFNKDGYFDVLLTGNSYEISTQLSRLDGSHGELLLNNKLGGFEEVSLKKFNISGAARTINEIVIDKEKYIIVGRNNNSPLFLKLN